jgi:hypothetical protein
MTPCAGLHHHPYPPKPGAQLPNIGSMGVIKLKRVNDDGLDVFGDVTHAKYPFSVKMVLYVDIRDAAYLLGKDFILAS